MFKMVKKMQNSGFEIVAGFTPPLKWAKNQSKWVQQVSLIVCIYNPDSKFDA